MDKRKKVNNVIASLLFVLIIGAFFIMTFVVNDKTFSENENRNLAQFPQASLSSISDGSFTKGFESYVQDQFPGRDKFVSLKTRAELLAGKKDNGLVYFGDDGYLFSIETINTGQLEKNIGYINAFKQNYGDELNVQLMVVPTASKVLSDKLPENAPVSDEDEALDMIAEKSQVEYIDLRDMLSEHLAEYIYYKTDHHWTSLGAFYAYQYWKENFSADKRNADIADYEIQDVSKSFYGTNFSKAMLSSIEPDTMQKFVLKNGGSSHMDIYETSGEKSKSFDSLYDESYLKVKDKYSYYLSGNNPVTIIKNEGAAENGKRALVIKDSFAHCFIPFLAEDYEEVIVVDMRYYRTGLEKLIDRHQIDDVIFLYNVLNLSNDKNLIFMNL